MALKILRNLVIKLRRVIRKSCNVKFLYFVLVLATIPFIIILLFYSFSQLKNSYTDKISQNNFFKNSNDLKSLSKNVTNKDYYEMMDFEGFDNQRGAPFYIVPNFVHLVYLNLNEISFYQAINIYSIFLNQKPDKIFIHCTDCQFSGHYWDEINSIKELRNDLVLNKIPSNDNIFGKRVEWIEHR